MNPDFYLIVNQEQTGPFSAGQIGDMVRNQEITAETPCSASPKAGWRTVRDCFPYILPTSPAFVVPETAPDRNRWHAGRGTDVVGGVLIACGVLSMIFSSEIGGIVASSATVLFGGILLVVARLQDIAAVLKQRK